MDFNQADEAFCWKPPHWVFLYDIIDIFCYVRSLRSEGLVTSVPCYNVTESLSARKQEPSQIESLHTYFHRWQLTYRDLEIERELSHRSRNAAITNHNFGFVFIHADHDKRLS